MMLKLRRGTVVAVEPPPSRWSMPTDGPIDASDIVAVGADLEPGTLLAAYRAGLFPMPFDRREPWLANSRSRPAGHSMMSVLT